MTPESALARSQLPRHAVALVLAGGRGSRLRQLTDRRSKPAVHFGGKFRIVDFALSNCLNSGIRRIGVVTQYKSHSLLRHLQRGWAFMKSEMNEFIDLLPAQQRLDEESWYRGTSDAVYQNLDIIRSIDPEPEYVVILAGDHIYKMDYSRMLAFHVEHAAEVTVGCIEVPRAEASAFGVMDVDEKGLIRDFVEKPAEPPTLPGKPDRSLASMGLYVFNAQYLYDALERDILDPNSSHDFGRDIIPAAVKHGVAWAQPFGDSCVRSKPDEEPYWRDVGTIDAYWEANIDLTATSPALNLYDIDWPIWTWQEQLPPAKFVHNQPDRRGVAIESMVSGGCIISGGLYRSLLFSKCRVHSYTRVDWSVLLPGVVVGRHARLTRVVVDRGVRIPEGLVVGEDAALDAQRFYRTSSGIVLITKDMINKLVAAPPAPVAAVVAPATAEAPAPAVPPTPAAATTPAVPAAPVAPAVAAVPAAQATASALAAQAAPAVPAAEATSAAAVKPSAAATEAAARPVPGSTEPAPALPGARPVATPAASSTRSTARSKATLPTPAE